MEKNTVIKSILYLLIVLSFFVKSDLKALAAALKNEIPIDQQDILAASDDFEEVSALEQGALERLRELGVSQGIEQIPKRLDYEKAVKVYVDTDIITIDSNDRETLLNALEAGNYVWVIPASTAYGNFQVTVARGLPLSEDAKPYLTEEEQQEIRDNEGKWEITEVAMDTVSPYMEQLNDHAPQLAGCTRVVITGSQTGFGMPVAVGFDDTAAKCFVGLGFQYPVAEGNVRNTSVYEYDALAERAKDYAVNSEAEQQWSGDEQQSSGLLPPAAQTQDTKTEENTGEVQAVQWQQIAIPMLVVFVLAGAVILQKRRQK